MANVYFFDEAMFTSGTLSRQVWAEKGEQRPSIEASRFKFKAVAAAAAIGVDGTVVAQKLYD